VSTSRQTFAEFLDACEVDHGPAFHAAAGSSHWSGFILRWWLADVAPAPASRAWAQVWISAWLDERCRTGAADYLIAGSVHAKEGGSVPFRVAIRETRLLGPADRGRVVVEFPVTLPVPEGGPFLLWAAYRSSPTAENAS
jgi:hypothetical protein